MSVIIKYTDSFVPMEIRIDVSSGEKLKKCIDTLVKQGTIKPDSVHIATISYDVVNGANPDEYSDNHYPLELSGDGTNIYIGGVTVGYDGDGPRLILDLLKNTVGLDVPFDVERAVLSPTYDKNGNQINKIQKTVFRRY